MLYSFMVVSPSDLHSCGMEFTEPQVSILLNQSLHEKGVSFLLDTGVWKNIFFQRTFFPYLHDESTYFKWKNYLIMIPDLVSAVPGFKRL